MSVFWAITVFQFENTQNTQLCSVFYFGNFFAFWLKRRAARVISIIGQNVSVMNLPFDQIFNNFYLSLSEDLRQSFRKVGMRSLGYISAKY